MTDKAGEQSLDKLIDRITPENQHTVNDKNKSFDLESVYDAEIAPLMDKIIAICNEHKLPMFATFLCANDPESGGDCVCTTNIMFAKERPVPDALLALLPTVMPRKSLRIRATKGDGSVEETVIL